MVAENVCQEPQEDFQTLIEGTCDSDVCPKAQVSRASSLPKFACSFALLAAGLTIAPTMPDS